MKPTNNPALTSSLLEIKNWTKYQKPNTTTWIKDYTNREDDLAFGKLTMFQRGLLEGICRLRARQARPIPNDPAYLSRRSAGASGSYCVRFSHSFARP